MFQLRDHSGLGMWPTAIPNMPATNKSLVDALAIGANMNFVTKGIPTSTAGGTAQQQTQLPTPSTVVNVEMPISKPWYFTWWGIGLLAGGAFFGYKKFIAKK